MITIHRNLNVSVAKNKSRLFIDSQPYKGGCLWVITDCSDTGSPRGRVLGYRTHLVVDNPASKISLATHKRTAANGCREVYARVYGSSNVATNPADIEAAAKGCREVAFVPANLGGKPTFFYADTGKPCDHWRRAYFTPTGMFVK